MAPVDWDEVRQKLASARDAWDQAFEPSAESRTATLKERAQQLAREPPANAPQDQLEILVFQLAAETYAVETRFVREVHPLRDLTPIPCTPPFVLGIINLRGELCPVIDLKRLFGLPERSLSNVTRAVIVRDESMELAIVADTIIGVRSANRTDLLQTPTAFSGIDAAFIHGITPDHIVILDLSNILAYPGIVVNEEVDN